MAIYLGSEKIIFTEGSKVEIESPYVRQIIEGTISGVYSNSRVSTIGSYAFCGCSNLTSIDLPQVTSIGTYAFSQCYSLTTINLPKCISIGGIAFASCQNLTSINLLECTSIGNSVFDGCYSLTMVSLPKCIYIGNYAFNYCYNLLSLYLLGSSVPTLSNISAFKSTPISNYTTSTGGVYGSIYVPASLYSNYITATNWSIYSARIVSM